MRRTGRTERPHTRVWMMQMVKIDHPNLPRAAARLRALCGEVAGIVGVESGASCIPSVSRVPYG
jgi:hypothetical protein